MALACANTLNAKNITAINPMPGRYQTEIASEKLVLNKGAKWKVDHTTNGNVDNLKLILKGFDDGTDRSLKAYKNAGDNLQNGLAKMIKECRMHGPNHLALHKWLEPLMAQVAKLKQASTKASAVQSINFIRLQLNRYNQFFEQ
ncbi:MAG TPA: hypothetical protein DCO83_06865 [Mucilaginibacter sp.]|nr:hypothetical protein [Mucilaginibacter sp.]